MLRLIAISLVVWLAATCLVAAPPKEASVTLELIGLHCESCADAIQDSLRQVKGVKSAKVSYEAKEALVQYDPDQCKVETLIKTVRETKGMAEFNAKVKKK
jgi:copper chaperone CopZ